MLVAVVPHQQQYINIPRYAKTTFPCVHVAQLFHIYMYIVAQYFPSSFFLFLFPASICTNYLLLLVAHFSIYLNAYVFTNAALRRPTTTTTIDAYYILFHFSLIRKKINKIGTKTAKEVMQNYIDAAAATPPV